MSHGLTVTCGTNSDCSAIPGKNVCKQDKDGGKTCQSTTSKELCSEEEFMDEEDSCTKPGKGCR